MKPLSLLLFFGLAVSLPAKGHAGPTRAVWGHTLQRTRVGQARATRVVSRHITQLDGNRQELRIAPGNRLLLHALGYARIDKPLTIHVDRLAVADRVALLQRMWKGSPTPLAYEGIVELAAHDRFEVLPPTWQNHSIPITHFSQSFAHESQVLCQSCGFLGFPATDYRRGLRLEFQNISNHDRSFKTLPK